MTAYNATFESNAENAQAAFRQIRTNINYHSSGNVGFIKQTAKGEGPYIIEMFLTLENGNDAERVFSQAESWEKADTLPMEGAA